jgi:hypothetical protein
MSGLFGWLTGSGGLSPGKAQPMHETINKIFTSLVVSQTNDVDIDKLSNPKVCKMYVFHLKRAIKDIETARKANELKIMTVESAGGVIDKVGYYPTKAQTLTSDELCLQMSIFQLQLIYLMYASALFTTTRTMTAPQGLMVRPTARPPAYTRKQRGGASPTEAFITFMERSGKFRNPDDNYMKNARRFFAIYPENVYEDTNESVLYQRTDRPTDRITFWVVIYKDGGAVQLRYTLDLKSIATGMDAIFYRCPSPTICDTTIPVLRGTGLINSGFGSFGGSGSGADFTLTTSNVIPKLYRSDKSNGSYNLTDIAKMLLFASKFPTDQLKRNRTYILKQGQGGEGDLRTLSSGLEGESVASGSGMTGFARIATDLRTQMVKDRKSLYVIRREMLTVGPDGRMTTWRSDFESGHIKRVIEVLSHGISHFMGTPVTFPSLINDLPKWESLRLQNEADYKNRANRVQIDVTRQRNIKALVAQLDTTHYNFTSRLATIISQKIIRKNMNGTYRINQQLNDIANMSSNKRINLIVEEIVRLMLQYFIQIESITRRGLNIALSYTTT